MGCRIKAANGRCWVVSDLGAFRWFQPVCNVYAEIADGILDLRMTKKKLNCAQVAGSIIDD